jgi:hypothetical protein
MPRPKPEPKKPNAWVKDPQSKWWGRVQHTLGSNKHDIVIHAVAGFTAFTVAEARSLSAWLEAVADYTEHKIRNKIKWKEPK